MTGTLSGAFSGTLLGAGLRACVQILDDVRERRAAAVLIKDCDAAVEVDGRRVLKAGTPLIGSLAERSVPFAVAGGCYADGVLLNDVDVTDGEASGVILTHGSVRLDRLEDSVIELLNDYIKASLSGKIAFCS